MKIYTKTGDDGTTGLIGNKRVKKSSPRIASYGMVDELNAAIGIILSSKLGKDITNLLTKIQNDLFVVGADLANPNMKSKSNRVTSEMITYLEKEIDRLEEKLSPITYFILPGGDLVASQIHLARAICRRAETNMVNLSEVDKINNLCLIYMNRLSDLLFVLARTINKRKKISDVAWKK
ncbi:Cob(I)yrinic acid a,c-diamide adenosyltransferase [Nitrosotalea devaniterrae]|uniref:Cob(I)yrinic acid a,c-diamide adenosyltransferase n=1 Tax=Nitrosotalea devaniterrae TaxID=1078905 RepID=A0A128A3C4_9ARCH|nr:Cob(I)yrinic acid a,c-diamide adenosyltransferase [Candidatus Nitrosotalea devanaterra]